MIVTMEQQQKQIDQRSQGWMTGQLREAIDEMDSWQFVGGNEPATYSGGPRTYSDHMTMVRDRADGRFRPFYDNEWDLRRMRSMARKFATYTSVAVGVMESLNVYVMGGDWEYNVEAKPEINVNPKLLKEMQQVVDGNIERNDWLGILDSEIHNRSREDGCSPIAIYGVHGGLCDFRRLEPECLTEPANKQKLDSWLNTKDSSWTFGVHTVYDPMMRRIDHTRHAGYHCVYDDGGKDWDYLPSWAQPKVTDDDLKCMHLINRNVTQSAKVGISDYFPVMTDLEREDKLNRNLSVGAALQAAIAWIEKVPTGTTKEAAQSELGDALDQFSRAISANKGTRTTRNIPSGHIIKTDHDYVSGPLGQLKSPIFIEVDKSIMRRIGRRWIFPDYMITGDTGSANFASTLVSEHPFVKAREKDQRGYVREFKQIHTKALYIAYLSGRFDRWVSSWRQLVETVDLIITPQEVASRDKGALLAEVTALYDRRAMDANELRTTLDHEVKPELDGVLCPKHDPLQGQASFGTDSQGGTTTDGDAQFVQGSRPQQSSTGQTKAPSGNNSTQGGKLGSVSNVRTRAEAIDAAFGS